MESDDPQILNDRESSLKKIRKFNFDEFIFKYRWTLTLLLVGAILVGLGVFFAKDSANFEGDKVEVLESATEGGDVGSELVVEVSGSVESPGVYKLASGARIEEALIAAGGVSENADREWMEKFLNRAAKISDGQKIYIPKEGESINSIKGTTSATGISEGGGVDQGGLININTATQKELESLWGIGPVYAQNIIEQRPYSSPEELLSKKVIKQNVYDKNKDKLTVY